MAEAGEEAPGTMAAVLGMEQADLEAALAEAGGIVAVANDNCPGQLVISGEVEAVRRAGEIASQRGAKRVLPLNVSGAFHSPLMENAAQEMRQALDGAVFGFPISGRRSTRTLRPSRWRTRMIGRASWRVSSATRCGGRRRCKTWSGRT